MMPKPEPGSATDPTTSGTKPRRTSEERRLLDVHARLRKQEGIEEPMTVQQENLVIDEAYFIGDL